MKKVLKLILGPFVGKVSFQPFFELIHKLGLYGMNVGGPSDLNTNGERNVLEYVKRKVNGDPVIFDVGANVGVYINGILQVFEQAEIHAFEPLQRNFDLLAKKFGGHQGIHLVQKGMGDKKGKLTIHFNPELGSMASVYHRQLTHHHIEVNASEEIEMETLDNYCKDHKVKSIDFLKLDVEGHELAALKGAQDLLQHSKVRFIQFEFGGTNIDSRTFFQDFWYLLSPRYRIYRIIKNGLREIKSYDENKEIFGYINYFAELK